MTLQEEQNSIKAFVVENSRVPSVFTCWQPERMCFEAYRSPNARTVKLLNPGDIERCYYTGRFADSDMFVLKAMHCFTYAPVECLLALVRYWKRRDVAESGEEQRTALAIPSFEKYSEMYNRLCYLMENGLVCRYAFYPLAPRQGREGNTESIFKSSGHATGFYKKKLLEKDMPYDPRDGYCNAEDAFAYSLGAYAVSAFLANPYVHEVAFKKEYEIERTRYKVKAEIHFNPEGRKGEPEDDTLVLFEGMTYQTNENLVTLERRKEYNCERILELAGVVQNSLVKNETMLVICAEDAYGIAEIGEFIREEAPVLVGRTLLTTERILYTAKVFEDPSNVKKCFLSLEEDSVKGATGYYFLEPEAGVLLK